MYSSLMFNCTYTEEEHVVSVFPNTHNKLHTTRSWNFVGLPLKNNRHSRVEKHMTVGLFDTGMYINRQKKIFLFYYSK